MGDIVCRVCGEPWDAYGVRHGDMTHDEAETLLRGQGCPSCHGIPPVYCGKDDGRTWEVDCEHFKFGRCRAPDSFKCLDKKPKHPSDEEDEMAFLESVVDSSDEDPIKLLDDYMDAKHRRVSEALSAYKYGRSLN